MQKSSRLWAIIIIVFAVVGGTILAYRRAQVVKNEPDLTVVATIAPLAEFAKEIGGDRVGVTTLTKPGMEPHDFEPTPREMAKLHKADMFVYNGAGLEPWVDKVVNDLQKSGVMTVDASFQIPLRTDNGVPDPHIWLDPQLALKQADTVKKGLMAIDPQFENTIAYTDRYAKYAKKLQDLNAAYTKGLQACQSKTIITSHEALGYLAARYGLENIGIAGLSPEDEPSPQKLAEIADLAKSKGVTHIFFEETVSPKLSETIARETGAQTASFNPVETLTQEELNAGKTYLSIQKDNLKALQAALRCTQ
jgi:zinc transport system substrate-binding protein